MSCINAIREDLEVSHRAVSHWLDILESLYYHFRVYPFAGKAIRSIKKLPKLYLWDWSEVADPGARKQLVFNGNFSYIEADQSIKTDKLVSTKGKKIYFIRFVETADKKTRI